MNNNQKGASLLRVLLIIVVAVMLSFIFRTSDTTITNPIGTEVEPCLHEDEITSLPCELEEDKVKLEEDKVKKVLDEIA